MTESAEERRVATRHRVLVSAQILFDNGREKGGVACVVRDVSRTGVKVIISRNQFLPREFELFVPEQKRSYAVRLRWRYGDTAGLSFTERLSFRKVEPAPEPVDAT
jgi:hypothetical protein